MQKLTSSSLRRSGLGRSGLGRRRFLQGSAAVMAGLAATNCRQNLSGPAAGGGGGDGALHIYTWANYT
ncbi:MAG: twin-arginine translocation signal domain-containing protein, partial [Nodosilinea sp.]